LGGEAILIGPMGAGKSTQGKLLAEALGLPQCSMDEIRWDYYREMGFDDENNVRSARKKALSDCPSSRDAAAIRAHRSIETATQKFPFFPTQGGGFFTGAQPSRRNYL
jgi:cytidylate kinase